MYWIYAIILLVAIIAVALYFVGCSSSRKENEYSHKVLKDVKPESIYSFSYETMRGDNVSLKEYSGRVLLIVNTASKCGYTGQYEPLEAIYQKYKDKGLVVIGFPCDQFMGQEPGSNEEIEQFCRINYGVTFPLSKKIEVNGPNKHLLYAWLTKDDATFPGKISWNFTKFMIGRDGSGLARFSPATRPDANEVITAIQSALDQSGTNQHNSSPLLTNESNQVNH